MAVVKNIDELQDKLDGIYDLNQVIDCRKIITVLLRSVRENKDECLHATDQLKTLAMMVINRNPKAAEKAKEVMEESGNSNEQVLDFLKNMASTADKVATLKDNDLVMEVTDKIWADLDMASRESALLGELIFRMKKLVGIK